MAAIVDGYRIQPFPGKESTIPGSRPQRRGVSGKGGMMVGMLSAGADADERAGAQRLVGAEVLSAHADPW